MLNLNLSALQSQEFIVGIAVAAILVSALVASSMFRNIALALAAGAVVLLYLQGGVPALLAMSQMVEKEIRALPDFSNGLIVGLCGVRGVPARDAEANGVVRPSYSAPGFRYDCPPLQLITWPVMKLASSEARNAIAAACSSGNPRRFSACWLRMSSPISRRYAASSAGSSTSCRA